MNNEYFIHSQHSISQYLHKNVDGNGMTNDINGYHRHRSRTYEEPTLCECSIRDSEVFDHYLVI